MEASHFAFTGCVVESAALMGGDMAGLVAFDFILGGIFRGVTHMSLVVEVSGVDRDNRPRHPACLGIPAYMIANLEPFNHPAESSFFPEALSSIRSNRRAPRHVRFMIETAALERVVNFSALFAAGCLRPLILPAVISSMDGTKGLSNRCQ
jgi:hypothetical protein